MATALLQEVQSLQEQRVKTYSELHKNHIAYLATGPTYQFEEYRAQVDKSTTGFKQIAARITQIGEELSAEHPKISKHISNLQSLEAEKLRETVELQLLKQQLQDFPGEDEFFNLKKFSEKKLAKLIEDINDILQELREEQLELSTC